MLPHVWKSYSLGERYEYVISKLKGNSNLEKYVRDDNYFRENEETKTIIYKTEILSPSRSENRIRVLLLFSNPNPQSIMAGMFLSPQRRINQFWLSMEGAEMFRLSQKIHKEDFPEPIRSTFLDLNYNPPFSFYFYTFFSFPSRDPEDLKDIFGPSFFRQMVNESRCNLLEFVQLEKINHIVCFGKQAFQFISIYDETYFKTVKYTKNIKEKGFMDSPLTINNMSMRQINLYLTYPTAQGGVTASERIKSLKIIKAEIQNRHKPSNVNG